MRHMRHMRQHWEWESVYQRDGGVRLRRTAFGSGGAAFLPERAATVELDEEAFALLCWLSIPLTARQLRWRLVEQFSRHITLAEVDRTVRQLQEYGFATQVQPELIHTIHTTHTFARATAATSCEPETVSLAPESVHLQLNNVCNLRCPSCYVGLQTEDKGFLPRERLMTLVNEMAELGVFQLALGGGEPLMSAHFVPMVRHARRSGLLPNVTTNGWLLTESLVEQIRGSIGEVRLSFNDGVSVHRDLLAEKAALLKAGGVRFGFNFIVTRRNVQQLGEILRWLVALGPSSLTLIRPKPAPHNAQWYAANALSTPQAMLLREQLHHLEPLFKETLLTVDCAFSYLFYGLSEAELIGRGVAGCAMGQRFVVVAWNGDVYPCSHLHGEEFKAGNVMEQSFRVIWETSPLFAHIRGELGHLEGHCGGCVQRRLCGGCRAIVWQTTGNWQAADAGCPANIRRDQVPMEMRR